MTHSIRIVLAAAGVVALSAGAAAAGPSCARGAEMMQGYGAHRGCVMTHRYHAHHQARHHAHPVLARDYPAYGYRAHGVRVIYGTPPVPRYYVNQGPVLTGPGVLVTGVVYDDQPIAPGYAYVRPYDGGPYASPTSHFDVPRRHYARPAGPGVTRADAVIRTMGPDRIDIQLYRRPD